MPRERVRFDGYNSDGEKASVYVGLYNGCLDIHDADIHTGAVNKYVRQDTATATTISTESAVNATSIAVANTAGFVVGDRLFIDTTTVETTLPQITAIAAGTPGTFTLDRRLDEAHLIGDSVTKTVINIKTLAGTLASPQIFKAAPELEEVWHIETISLTMAHTGAGNFDTFGGIPKLTNGLVLRVRLNGVYSTLTNWKDNGEINDDTNDVQFITRAGVSADGTVAAGEFKRITGAIIKLDGSTLDQFEVYCQDNLTALGFLKIKIQGHLEL